MKHLLLLSIVFIFFSFDCRSNHLKDTIVLLGENHQQDNCENKIRVIKEYLKFNDSLTIFLELPISYTKDVRDFISDRNNAKNKFNRDIRKNYFQNKKDIKNFLIELKNIFQNDHKEIEVICFDMELAKRKKPFQGLDRILKYYPKIKKTKLQNYLAKSNLSDIDLIEKELRSDSVYKSILKKDYNLLLNVLTSIDISLNSGKQSVFNNELMKKREEFMCYIIKSFGRSSVKLIFIGQDHVSKLENDPWFDFTTLRVLLEKNESTLVSIYTIYQKEYYKLFSIFALYADNLCEPDFKMLLKLKFLFSSSELECSPELSKRCDYLTLI